MNLFGYPPEIWAAAIVAMLIRLQTSNRLSILGAVVTVVVALFAGVFLHGPVMVLFGLSNSWSIPIAIIVALSAENLMKAVVEISADREWLKDLIKYLVTRGDNRNDKHHD